MKINNIWYNKHPLALALTPLSWLFCAMVKIRQQAYKQGLLTCHHVPVPVIVVGNVTVGGTGKTPLVNWLGQFLQKHGFKPGIVSRGYGGHAQKWPQFVLPESDPYLVGDEPVLLARQSGCPVAVAPQRILAVQSLLTHKDCNLIISDDGLQHYALQRDIEIVVVDGIRRYGNQRCLPAGPLREPISRLQHVDFVITKGNPLDNELVMQYHKKSLQRLDNDTISQPLAKFHDHTVHAIAGIGYPEPFFNYLREQGLKLHCHEFPDHYAYQKSDIQFNDNLPVIMTEKDAVKCQSFAKSQHWYLPIEAHLPAIFGQKLLHQLQRIQDGQKIT
jgi:tetraacyldisaccharide 4'-kinase